MSSKSLFLLSSFVCFTLFLYGAFQTLIAVKGKGKNDCKMTFMFEFPNYVVSLKMFLHNARQTPSWGLIKIDALTNFYYFSNNQWQFFFTFQKINFEENMKFPNYNLWAVSRYNDEQVRE
jgi:hypothetical protein